MLLAPAAPLILGLVRNAARFRIEVEREDRRDRIDLACGRRDDRGDQRGEDEAEQTRGPQAPPRRIGFVGSGKLGRSEERRVGTEGVSRCRSRWSAYL